MRRRQVVVKKPFNWFGVLGPALVLAAAAAVMVSQDREEAQRWRIELDTMARKQAEMTALLDAGDFRRTWSHCRDLWVAELSYYHEPQALAFTRAGLAAYFLQGLDRRSLRQVRCSASGIDLGPRVPHPLASSLPVEGLSDEQGERLDDAWSRAFHSVNATPLQGDLLAIELLLDPSQERVMRRDWRGLEGGAVASLQSIDGDSTQTLGPEHAFPMLLAERSFALAEGSRVAAIEPITPRNWMEQPLAALDAIAVHLPESARIAEISIREHRIEVQIAEPTPAFDNNPPAPFGDLGFDEYGIPDRSWWYPRTTPGFGCEQGRQLDSLRQELKTQLRPGPFTLIWYSCSTAYSDGRNGRWVVR